MMPDREDVQTMPIYEYECTQCGKIEEAIQRFSDPPLTQCKTCSGTLHKLVSQSSFHLKGSGWYVTDYAAKSRNPAASSDNKSDGSSDSTSGKTEKADIGASKPTTEGTP